MTALCSAVATGACEVTGAGVLGATVRFVWPVGRAGDAARCARCADPTCAVVIARHTTAPPRNIQCACDIQTAPAQILHLNRPVFVSPKVTVKTCAIRQIGAKASRLAVQAREEPDLSARTLQRPSAPRRSRHVMSD